MNVPLKRPFLWNAAGAALRSGSGFVLGVLLGRLLGPGPFGLVAAALLPISLGQLLVDQGLSAEVVQKATLTAQDLRRARRWQLGLGAGLSLVFAALAPRLAAWYRLPGLLPVLWALSPLFFLQAMSQVPLALLKRQMRFRRLQGIQVGSYLLGYLGVGIPLALLGKGVWALVAAQGVQVVLLAGLAWRLCPEPANHALPPGEAGPGPEAGFAWRVMATNLTNWNLTNLGAFLIGRQFGAVDLGLFNRAKTLLQAPTGIVMTSTQGVLFPAAAQLQADTEALAAVFRQAVRRMAWFVLPFSALALAWAHPMVEGLYGPVWRQGATLFPPLLAALPFTLLMGIPGPMLLGLGIAGVELRVQLVLGGLLLPLLWFGGRYGLHGLLWVLVLMEVLRWVWMTQALLGRLGKPWVWYLGGLGLALAASLPAYGGARLLEQSLLRMGLSPLLRLLVELGSTGGVGTLIWAILRRSAAPTDSSKLPPRGPDQGVEV